jgi:hypothetical protein
LKLTIPPGVQNKEVLLVRLWLAIGCCGAAVACGLEVAVRTGDDPMEAASTTFIVLASLRA